MLYLHVTTSIVHFYAYHSLTLVHHTKGVLLVIIIDKYLHLTLIHAQQNVMTVAAQAGNIPSQRAAYMR